MNKIWAPWRIKYIRALKQKGCLFCLCAKNNKIDKQKFVILRGKHSYSLLNIYPYNNGHFMVCPKKHVKDIEDLNKEELLDLWQVLKQTKKLVKKTLKPEGYNVGINLGKVSGAGIDKHLHIHVVPRWKGDTNFMPVISDNKIVSQSLKELYSQLTKNK